MLATPHVVSYGFEGTSLASRVPPKKRRAKPGSWFLPGSTVQSGLTVREVAGGRSNRVAS